MPIDFSARYIPTPRQLVFHNETARYRGIGGAMAGGKSRGGCAEMIQRCLDFPGNRVGILRKNRTTLKKTTLVSFLAITPPDMIANFNRTDLEITLFNGSSVLFVGADITKDPDLEDLGSLELGAFFLDEGAEVPEKVFTRLATRIAGRWILPDGTHPIEIGVVSFNPFPGWCEDRFVTKLPDNHSYTQFLMRDNPHIDKERIKELYSVLSDVDIRRFIEGEFIRIDEPNQLVPYQWCRDAIIPAVEDDIAALLYEGGKQSLGVDVARYGDDKSVIYRVDTSRVLDKDVFDDISTHQLAETIKARMSGYSIDADRTVIDAVGIGAGVCDMLIADNYHIKEFVAGAKATRRFGRFKFKNLRSLGYWFLREQLKNGEFGIPDDKDLIEDITAHRYSISGDRMISVESKDMLKKRIGRSPDDSDALVCAMVSEFVPGTSGGSVDIL